MQGKYVLIIVLLIALLLRVVGTIPGHNYYHPDEPMSYDSAMTMIMHDDANPRRFDYPAGVPLLHDIIFQNILVSPLTAVLFFRNPHALSVAITQGQEIFWDKFNPQIFGKGELWALFASRVITALLGFLTVVLVYKIGRDLFSETAGLTSAAFLAVNYRHILSSHLALSDIPNALFALLSFYTAILVFQKPTRFRYMACGIAVGMSIAMKYQVYAILPFLFVHGWWAIRKRSFGWLFHRDFFLSMALIIGTFIILNPYIFFNIAKVKAGIALVYLRYGAGTWKFNPYPLFFLYHWGIGVGPSIAILLGFIVSLIFFPFQTLFVLTYVGPFLFTFLYYLTGGSYVRNFTTVIPFVFIFAGVLVSRIKFPQWILVILVFLVSLATIKDSLALDAAYSGPWTRERLGNWVMQTVPENSVE